ncbi:hypothetical protein LTR09_011046 [Extremus antarcticus]|uniref:Ankyrin repeat protein n=1 Tax=Extremus antarcticus TaxID=702011 RepID=A0AAJ0D6L4_9PEZI|nr:hypothetical protein LTR09_011046 [Extremus antarcticus]
MAQPPPIDRLLSLVPDAPDTVLSQLRTYPELASKQDSHGYSLLHAATSYNHISLVQALIREFQVDINIRDEDGETCLFNAEDVDFSKELIELGVDIDARNDDGQSAAEKLDDDDEQPEVAAYLKGLRQDDSGSSTTAANSGTESIPNGEPSTVHPPPPLPNGVQVNIGTMHENEAGEEPDPEFRRRIEELAARPDFEASDTQRELRDLVSDAVSGISHEGQGPASRRRLG